jgi:hypothetical protein
MEFIPQNQKSFLTKKVNAAAPVVVPISVAPVAVPVSPAVDHFALLESRCEVLEKTIDQLLHDFANISSLINALTAKTEGNIDKTVDNVADDEIIDDTDAKDDLITAADAKDDLTTSAATGPVDTNEVPLSRSQKKKLNRRVNQN